MLSKFCVGVVISLLSCGLMGQERFTHEPSGLSFVLPAGWSYAQEGD